MWRVTSANAAKAPWHETSAAQGNDVKLLSFSLDGRPRFGATDGKNVWELDALLDHRFADLQDFLARGLLEDAQALVRRQPASLRLDQITFLPVIPRPGKIWCCGLNYHEHADECGVAPTSKPTFFLRVADSQVGHGEAIVRPLESQMLDFEAEIAVVIGRGGRRIRAEDALAHVAGYTCYNDASVRDWQLQTTQWDAGKNFWRTGGFGPWLVTADEIPPGKPLSLVGRLNGQEVQAASTSMLIHDIAAQIAYVSTIAPLEPGDVIVTGTPGGIGAKRSPSLWLQPGDLFEVEVEGVGVLRNTVIDG